MNVVPAIARDPLDSQAPALSWLPTPQGLEFSQAVIHDYAGLAWYRLRGWL